MPDLVVVSTGPLARIAGVRGVVHAVFPAAVYIRVADGTMLVVHGPGHGHTPTSLIVDRLPSGGWGAVAGDSVAGGHGHLRLGAMRLDARQAHTWRPRVPVDRDAAAAATALPAIEAAATPALAPPCRRLARALAADDHAAIAASVAAMVGTGPGLTPAGDDALVGLLALLHRAGARRARPGALRLLCANVHAQLHRTTPISAHFLGLAAAGHFGEALTDLVDSFGAGPLARVRATGASSGADALAGVAAGLHLLLETETNLQVEETA